MSILNFIRPKWKHRSVWVREKAARQLTDQGLLAKLAQTDSASSVRMAAADGLADQVLAQKVFADIAKTADDAEMRLTAAEKLTDKRLAQKVFAEIAKNDYYGRMKAFALLTDQSLLAGIAKTADDAEVRLAAALKLTDKTPVQGVFAEIVKNDSVPRNYVLECLTDQTLLADIARTAKDAEVRLAAAEKLTDETLNQGVFVEIARNGMFYGEGPEKILTRLALKRLTDQRLLADIAKTAKNWEVKIAATEKLSQQELLADIAKTADNLQVRLTATRGLTDSALAQTMFADIAKTNGSQEAVEATQCLTDQALLADFAQNAQSPRVRLAATRTLTDQRLLADIAMTAAYLENDVGVWATQSLTDQTLLADIARTAKCDEVGLAATRRLTDQALLADIAKTSQHPKVRYEAAKNLTDDVLAQTIFADILTASPDREVAVAIARRLTNQALLAHMARAADDEYVRLAAAEGLSEPALAQRVFADLALTGSWGYDYTYNEDAKWGGVDHIEGVAEKAVNYLKDADLLMKVATGAKDEQVRLSATERLRQATADVAKFAKDTKVQLPAEQGRKALSR